MSCPRTQTNNLIIILQCDCLQNVLFEVISLFVYRGHSEGKTTAFRSQYGELAIIRSMVPSKIPFVALTATATSEIKEYVTRSLGLKDTVFIQESPDRPNIKSFVIHTKETKVKKTFAWLTSEIKNKGSACPRYIIYCRTIEDCSRLYAMFENELGRFTPATRPFAMYHSETQKELCDIIVNSFKEADGHIRVLFASIAFGMGVDCKGLYSVIHYGPPKSVDEYVQESGRCGRDGKPSTSLLIHYPGSTGKLPVKEDMKALLRNQDVCRREYVLQKFGQSRQWNDDRHIHECCDVCAKSCMCAGTCCDAEEAEWIRAIKNLDNKGNICSSVHQRYVSHEQEMELKKRCLEYRDSTLAQDISDDVTSGNVYSGKDLASGVPLKTIDKLVTECNFEWTLMEFQARYRLFGSKHAEALWAIVNEVVGNAPLNVSDTVTHINLLSVYDVEPEFDNVQVEDDDSEFEKALLCSESDSDSD